MATYRLIAFTIIPIIRPKVAPMAIEGTKIPAGTLHPYEIMTKKIRKIVARSNESVTDHCTEVLHDDTLVSAIDSGRI